MSVWKAACYRDDALQNLAGALSPVDLDCEFIYSLCDFRVEDPGDFPLPAGIGPGNLRKQVEGKPELLLQLIERRPERFGYPHALALRLKTLPPARFGVHGVYKFVAENWGTFTGPAEKTELQQAFFDQIFAYGYAASYRTGAEAIAKSRSVRKSLERFVERPYRAIRDLVSVGSGASRDRYRRATRNANFDRVPLPEIEHNVPTWLRSWRLYWYRSVLLAVPPREHCTYVFTRDDIDRIERFTLGLAWCGYYLAEYSDQDQDLRSRLVRAYGAVLAIIKKALDSISKDDANKLCRAFDVALWMYCAEVATDVDDGALRRQEEKARKEGLSSLVDLPALLAIARGFKLREALEILQIYKAFPQPDFDYFGAAARQMELYTRQRPYGEDAETENTGPYEDLWRYFILTLIRAYHKRHGICPGRVKDGVEHRRWHDSYPHLPPEKVPLEGVDDLDLANSFRYAAHGSDILDLIQDKAICPEQVSSLKDASALRDLPVEDKNYLMSVLNAPSPISLLDLHGTEPFDDVKAEDKPEAKKPNGRWFFEAGTTRRLLHSEYELSVAEYAKCTVGCMSGKSTREKVAAMNYICELQHGPDFSPYRPLLVSFDLDKFSPSLEMDYHERSDLIMATLFGKPHLKRASDVFQKGNVHYIKRRVHHVFPKQGRDFEGFSGRKNTIYHCAVMGYTVRRLRMLGLIPEGGRFASLIDDGLLRLHVPKDGYKERVQKILQVIEEVYQMANLYISWDKTFVSEHFCVFLNEFYYKGTPVTPGIRSFLKITSRADSLCPSFPDDLAKLESTARGAIAAGAPAHLTYGAYSFHVLDLVHKWGKGTVKLSDRLALAMFLPVALGGFGASSVAALSGSIAGPPLVEGIGNMRAIAVRFRGLAPTINAMINVQMRQLTEDEKLRAPMAVRRQGRTLKTTRARQVLERRLTHMLDTPVIRALLGDVRVRQDDAALHALVHKATLPVEALELVRDSSLATAISDLAAKFLRTRTAFKLVRPRAFFRATIANFTEARALLREWA